MNNLILLPSITTTEERIFNQIEAFRAMFLTSEGDIEICAELVEVIIDYLAEFDDENLMLNQAYVKLQEASYWIDSSMGY
jgi:hypothetical protein